jgi:AraC-like DNA-binding protein
MSAVMHDQVWERWLDHVLFQKSDLRMVAGLARRTHWDAGERRLDRHALHYVISGGYVGHIGDVSVRSTPGSVLWVPAGLTQHLRSAGTRPMSFYWLRFALPDAPIGQQVMHARMPLAYPLFVRLYQEHAAALPGRDQSMRALLLLLLTQWCRGSIQAKARLSDTQRAEVLDLMDRDPSSRLTVAALAHRFGMSAPVFTQRFQRTFGSPPRTWFVKHRIALAAQRLRDSRARIGVIAEEFGYPDIFLFSRQFKRVMGVTPTIWRDQSR